MEAALSVTVVFYEGNVVFLGLLDSRPHVCSRFANYCADTCVWIFFRAMQFVVTIASSSFTPDRLEGLPPFEYLQHQSLYAQRLCIPHVHNQRKVFFCAID